MPFAMLIRRKLVDRDKGNGTGEIVGGRLRITDLHMKFGPQVIGRHPLWSLFYHAPYSVIAGKISPLLAKISARTKIAMCEAGAKFSARVASSKALSNSPSRV